jgi:gas vesicle protein
VDERCSRHPTPPEQTNDREHVLARRNGDTSMTAGNFETTPSALRRPGEPENVTAVGGQPPAGLQSAGPQSAGEGRAETAKGEARQVAETAVGSGKQVAQTAKVEAQSVVGEAKSQAASLLDTVRTEVGTQLGTQHHRVADSLRNLSQELDGMAASSSESGPMTDLVQQASRKGGEVATWLQDREPADVLEAVRSYGRRHPVTFLALCGLAGVVAGRLTRSAVATRTALDTKDDNLVTKDDNLVTKDDSLVTKDDRGSAGRWSHDVPPPAISPLAEPAVSTGVYGGSVESTGPATTGPASSRPPVVGPGSAGSFDVPSRPAEDPLR